MGRLPIVTVLCLMAAACSHQRVTPAAADMSAREDLSATRDLSVREDLVQEEDLATPDDLASRVDMAVRGDLATVADLALPPGLQWVFANYNGAQTVWD